MEKISGIYSIVNTINNKYYIGKSNNIYRRWYDEKLGLKNGTFHNIHLQRAWNLYGSEAFIFSIIEKCDELLLAEREIFWISYFDSYNCGYNQTVGGEGSLGLKCSTKTKEKLRITHTGKCNTMSQPVYCVELDCTLWGAKEAQDLYGEQYKVNSCSVSRCCNGKMVYSGRLPDGRRLHWCYDKDKEFFITPITTKDVPVYCNELDEYFENFQAVENDNRISKVYHTNLKSCCDGSLQHTTCGHLVDGTKLTWRYLTDEELNALFRVIKKN